MAGKEGCCKCGNSRHKMKNCLVATRKGREMARREGVSGSSTPAS